MGRDNTRRNIKKSFYWHNLYNDVVTYVTICAACSKNKKANKRKRAGMTEYHASSPMDQGSNFVGNVFRSVFELLEIRKTQTTPYHPESNGQIERYNHTIVEMVQCLKLKSEKRLGYLFTPYYKCY